MCSERAQGVALAVGLGLLILFLDSGVVDLPALFGWEELHRILLAPRMLETDELLLPQLGHYAARGYYHVPKTCSSIHVLGRDVACKGDSRALLARRCGGIPLVEGLCVQAETAVFNFSGAENRYARHRAARMCGSDPRRDAEAVRAGHFAVNGHFVGPADGCDVADVNPRWLAQLFRNKLIVFVGDSHARNMFTALVAEIRNQRFVAERHPDQNAKEKSFPYRKYVLAADSAHDSFHVMPGSNALTASSARHSGCEGCVVVLFIWAGFRREYERTLPVVARIQPDVVITNWLSPGYYQEGHNRTEFDRFCGMWESLVFSAPARGTATTPMPFVVIPFALSGGGASVPLLRNWLFGQPFVAKYGHSLRPFVVDERVLLEAWDRTGESTRQLQRTSHSVCGMYDTFALQGDGETKVVEVPRVRQIVAYQDCTAALDRAMVRIALTFASIQGV